jgi:hypothetical protein
MDENLPDTAAARQATSWEFGKGMGDMCRCGHFRGCHAFPGAAGTPCSERWCVCQTFYKVDDEAPASAPIWEPSPAGTPCSKCRTHHTVPGDCR